MSPEQLTDVWLGSNSQAKTGYALEAPRGGFDISTASYERAGWSIACNHDQIDRGTIGWIFRADGSWGHMAGLIAFTGPPEEDGPNLHYAKGQLFPLPREWWLDGARMQLNDWGTSPPFGLGKKGVRVVQLQAGQAVPSNHTKAMTDHLHPVAREWIAARRF